MLGSWYSRRVAWVGGTGAAIYHSKVGTDTSSWPASGQCCSNGRRYRLDAQVARLRQVGYGFETSVEKYWEMTPREVRIMGLPSM